MLRFLVIQTAFTGDVVLATAVTEKLHQHYPDATIHFLLRKGNEGLLDGHPYIGEVIVWNKNEGKMANLVKIISRVRSNQYTHVINLHRFASSGIITALSGAAFTVGFDKNPLSPLFTHKIAHQINTQPSATPVHETSRNQLLIASMTDATPAPPALYPTTDHLASVAGYKAIGPYVCIAPSSVWFTKQFPTHKWAQLIRNIPPTYHVYLIGGPGDEENAQAIIAASGRAGVSSLCGKLSYLSSVALMKDAVMNYANDSAPLHFASAINAPLTAVFCSTIPAFGFGPLRPEAKVVETTEPMPCRPCGLHGHRECPKGHFNCANTITNQQLLWWTLNKT
jgi:heptosyltransferase-2